MPYELYLKETLNVGTSALIPCDSNHKPYAVMFEDDGETGYFYACTVTAIGSPRILDAVHIYNVKDVLDKDEASEIKIGWSPDDMQASKSGGSALLINSAPSVGREPLILYVRKQRISGGTNWKQSLHWKTGESGEAEALAPKPRS